MDDLDALTRSIIGAAIEVHRILGPGLLEKIYERCLFKELELRGIPRAKQVPLPIVYKGEDLGAEIFMVMVVDGRVILELKTVDRLEPIHSAQLLTYMKLSGIRLGLLLNFNVPMLRDGIKRLIL
jgi:GxxExxY protein